MAVPSAIDVLRSIMIDLVRYRRPVLPFTRPPPRMLRPPMDGDVRMSGLETRRCAGKALLRLRGAIGRRFPQENASEFIASEAVNGEGAGATGQCRRRNQGQGNCDTAET